MLSMSDRQIPSEILKYEAYSLLLDRLALRFVTPVIRRDKKDHV